MWPWLRRVAAALALGLALTCAMGPAGARAEVAPEQWLPTSADLVRTLRPCPDTVSASTGPICWSVREDLSAWMALPSGSPYPWGQCTYYAGLMRPDIWNDRAPPSSDPPGDWDAWAWVAHAQAEGLSVDGDPRPGDVMVYSPSAVGNDTGHVAIVDAVGGSDPRTRDLLVTVSEMNARGLDDPAFGQGDTITIPLPRSELVPGMIQFIHQPGPGYAPPVWADGTGAAEAGGSPPSAVSDPSLAVGLFGDRLETVSESTAPEHAVVTSMADGRKVTTLSLAANRVATLHLPRGSYRVCVTQPARGPWTAASGCVSGGWPVTAITPTVSLAALHPTGRRMALALVLGPQAELASAVGRTSVTAVVAVVTAGTVRRGRARAAIARLVYRRFWRLSAGRQVLRLTAPAGSFGRHAVVTVSVEPRTIGTTRIAPARASIRLS